MAEEKQQASKVSEHSGGLNLDNSPITQPKSTQTFALNVVNESQHGDESFRGNEESNEICTTFKTGYIPLEKCYLGDNTTAIFLVSGNGKVSEIGILNSNDVYETHVNDEYSVDKLNFKVTNQIQATFRLRRGCERTVYFTDNINKPRYYNFDRPEKFQDKGQWVGKRFDLFKSINKIPEIKEIDILEGSGFLIPGSYSILFQYLDEDFNGSKFVELISNINIYNDSVKNNFVEIQGSTNLNVEGIKAPATSKAIKLQLNNLDETYTYYRLAIVEYNSGTGQVSNVYYTNNKSIYDKNVTYTGSNSASVKGTIAEIELANINSDIHKAESIEQIDNKLFLANTQGISYDFCNLQKYASKIKADVVLKDIILTSVTEQHNSKNPLVHYNGLSHQPGDIYSYGIIYVFDDLTESPVYHIPGKNNKLESTTTFISGRTDIKGMSTKNNKNLTETYINTNKCGKSDYWGRDSEGEPLTNTNVRHHRFPTREEIKIGFVKELGGSTHTKFKRLQLELKGTIKKSKLCEPPTITSCSDYYKAPEFILTVKYKADGKPLEFTTSINSENNVDTLSFSNIFLESEIVTDIELFYKEVGKDSIKVDLISNVSTKQSNDLTYEISYISGEEETGLTKYEVPILGIAFSNIELPKNEDSKGNIIGYKIVRQERKDSDKNIMDTGVLFPITYNVGQGTFFSASMIAPHYDGGLYPFNISGSITNVICPSHKFTDKNIEGFTSIEETGRYVLNNRHESAFLIENVKPGSSADGLENINEETSDNDGFSLKHMVRMSKVKYAISNSNKVVIKGGNVDLHNLQPMGSAIHSDGSSLISNLSCDNKNLILSSKTQSDINRYLPNEQYYPYVSIKKEHSVFYNNYRLSPYYQTNNKVMSESTCELFYGDTHIVPYKHSNHIYGDTIAGRRNAKYNWQKAIVGALLIIVSIVLIAVSGGILAPLAAKLVTIGASLVIAGEVLKFVAGEVKAADFEKLYKEKWFKGLNFTLFDKIYQQLFYEPDVLKPRVQLDFRDDTIKWYGETIQDFWFETPLNLSLRVHPTGGTENYLRPLRPISPHRQDKIQVLREVNYDESTDERGLFAPGYYRFMDNPVNWDMYEEGYFGMKLLKWIGNRWDYQGLSTPVIFFLNNDHNVNKSIIRKYALPLEYDCCTDCKEKFPHRIHWSEQSFQEELTDNYRTFLPNNYKDIDGETGEITNIFKIGNNLYVHTREALWQIPRSYQERVTDQVVSFIGTGSYLEIPPQKVLDDETGNSAGCQHKRSVVKTPSGIYFVSENQSKIYHFDGKRSKSSENGSCSPISDKGISKWFSNNLKVVFDEQYRKTKGTLYPYRDNPSNPFGTGFISVYDSKKDRVIFTKKDFTLSSTYTNENDYEICVSGNKLTIFPNVSQTVREEEGQGWVYLGVENCQLKFSKDVVKTRIEKRSVEESVFKDVDDLVFTYRMQAGLRDLDTKTVLLAPIRKGPYGWQQPGSGDYNEYIQWSGDQTDEGVETIKIGIKSIKRDFPSARVITFTAEAFWHNQGNGANGGVSGLSAEAYKGGNFVIANKAFVNIGGTKQGQYAFPDKFITGPKFGAIGSERNIGTFNYEIETGALTWDGMLGGEIPIEKIIKLVDVKVEYVETEYKYIGGKLINSLSEENNSWTMSYNQDSEGKKSQWVSWHSYLPNMYISVPDKFYSWKYGNSNLWKHNRLGHYQTFYNKLYPFIVEFISNNEPTTTKVYDSLSFMVEAKKYIHENKEFVAIEKTFFNKMYVYNSRQCSGMLDIKVKDENQDYLFDQVNNLNSNEILADKNEKKWGVNNLRDIRIDYTKPIFNSSLGALQTNYYIDKIINDNTIDYNKDWSQLESFRDKYLAVRLIFDKFANTKLLLNFTEEDDKPSFR